MPRLLRDFRGGLEKTFTGIISGIFTKAEDWGYWESRNPASRVSLGRKRPKRQKRILTDDQIRELLAAVPLFVRLMIELAVSTSMRISEILGLKWRCVDLRRGLVHVEERYYRGDTDEPKSERSRRPLPLGYLTGALRQHKPSNAPPDDYVFHKDGEPLGDRAILRDYIRPAAQQLGFYLGVLVGIRSVGRTLPSSKKSAPRPSRPKSKQGTRGL